MNHEDLSARLWRFAARVGKVVDALPDTRMRIYEIDHLAIPDFQFSIFNHAFTQTPLLRRRCLRTDSDLSSNRRAFL